MTHNARKNRRKLCVFFIYHSRISQGTEKQRQAPQAIGNSSTHPGTQQHLRAKARQPGPGSTHQGQPRQAQASTHKHQHTLKHTQGRQQPGTPTPTTGGQGGQGTAKEVLKIFIIFFKSRIKPVK
jgi:hypothetical protein